MRIILPHLPISLADASSGAAGIPPRPIPQTSSCGGASGPRAACGDVKTGKPAIGGESITRRSLQRIRQKLDSHYQKGFRNRLEKLPRHIRTRRAGSVFRYFWPRSVVFQELSGTFIPPAKRRPPLKSWQNPSPAYRVGLDVCYRFGSGLSSPRRRSTRRPLPLRSMSTCRSIPARTSS